MCSSIDKAVWDEGRLADPHGQPDKAARVCAMFDEVAPTYELVNSVLSVGRDRYWRRCAAAMARTEPTDRVLDLGCGTGDFAREFARASPASVVGCDFSQRMLDLAISRNQSLSQDCGTAWPSAATNEWHRRPACDPTGETPVPQEFRDTGETPVPQEFRDTGETPVPQECGDTSKSPIEWCRADAQSLPFGAESFTVVSCAFSIRNFQDLSQGLAEMFRVLAPGGRAVILEFSMPRAPLLGGLYLFYFRRILPRLAALISGDRSGAYRYLPASVSSFIDATGMIEKLRSAGFGKVEHRRLTIGIVTVFVAWKD